MHSVITATQALVYSCYSEVTREEERFVQETFLTRVLEGSIVLNTASARYTFKAGDTVLIKRNQLINVTRMPAAQGEFKSVSVFFSQQNLRDYAAENQLQPTQIFKGNPISILPPSPFFESYATSLTAYQQGFTSEGLTTLKVKEALMLSLHVNPELSNLLFDFQEPEKIELEEFMEQHFKFNVSMSRFAYLTGRSLATFKRDFPKSFYTSPGKWLQLRRLKEARYLLKERKMKVSDVYHEVGFEDLSHFSFAFKKAFGFPPSSR